MLTHKRYCFACFYNSIYYIYFLFFRSQSLCTHVKISNFLHRSALQYVTVSCSWLQSCSTLQCVVVHCSLVDNFSHESDVTSLQDIFTSRPEKIPFYWSIVFHINSEETFSLNDWVLSNTIFDNGILSQFNTDILHVLDSLLFALVVYANAFRPMFPLVRSTNTFSPDPVYLTVTY